MRYATDDTTTLKRTPLYRKHVSLGARMAPFGGFEMPIQYCGIIDEHMAARKHAAVFDTCHMGEFHFRGPAVVEELERIVTCPVASMEIGQCRYGFVCNESGGVIDDQVLYRMDHNDFFMVVNASTQDTDFVWITQHMSSETSRKNLSETTAKIDLQGPASPRIMQRLMQEPIDGMKYYRHRQNNYRGKKVLTSRTGYTGEIGFEIYCEPDLAECFFDDCLECGAKPAGLGARDTLRLEMGMPLYGHELDMQRNPAETGFLRSIDTTKRFIGSPTVLDPSAAREKLVGLMLATRRAARAADRIVDSSSEVVGTVTSGSFSPSLQKAIALGYVKKRFGAPGTALAVDTGRGRLEAVVADLPFWREATARKPIAKFL